MLVQPFLSVVRMVWFWQNTQRWE